MSGTHGGFLVKQHRPIYRVIVVVVALIVLTVIFFAGRWDQDRSLRHAYEMVQELNVSFDQLTQRNDELVRKNARLSADSKVDRDVYNSVNESLIRLQREILTLKEELVFYRGIVAPSAVNLGVNLQEVTIVQSVKENVYHYKIVLTKIGRSKFSIRGDIQLSIQGLVDGKTKVLPLNDMSEFKKNELKYSFKYFQIFEGDILLPKQFYPEEVKVDVKSRTKKVKSIKGTFNWAELVSGEI